MNQNIEASNINPITKRTIRNEKVKPGNCIFPFKYKNKLHYNCIENEKGQFWCATSVNPKTNQWKTYGFCPLPEVKSEHHTTERITILPSHVGSIKSIILKTNNEFDFNKSYLLIDGSIVGHSENRTEFRIINIHNRDIPGCFTLGHYREGETLIIRKTENNYSIDNNPLIFIDSPNKTKSQYEILRERYTQFYSEDIRELTIPKLELKSLTKPTQTNVYIFYSKLEDIQSLMFKIENETDYNIKIIKEEKQSFNNTLFSAFNHQFYTHSNEDNTFSFKDNLGILVNAATYDDTFVRKDLELVLLDMRNPSNLTTEQIDAFVKTPSDDHIQILDNGNAIRVSTEIMRAINGMSNNMFQATSSFSNIYDRFCIRTKTPSKAFNTQFYGLTDTTLNQHIRTLYATNMKDDGYTNNNLYEISREEPITGRITSYNVILTSQAVPNRNILSIFFESINLTLYSSIYSSIEQSTGRFIRPNSDITKILQHNYYYMNIENLYRFIETNRDISKLQLLLLFLQNTKEDMESTLFECYKLNTDQRIYTLPFDSLLNNNQKSVLLPPISNSQVENYLKLLRSSYNDTKISIQYNPKNVRLNSIVSVMIGNVIRPEIPSIMLNFAEPTLHQVCEINSETGMAYVKPIVFGLQKNRTSYIHNKSQKILVPLRCCFNVVHPDKSLPHMKLDKSDKIDSFIIYYKNKINTPIWMKLDNDAYYFMNDSPRLVKTVNDYYYTGIDDSHLYFIYQKNRKWVLQIDNNEPTNIITSHGSITDILNNQNVIIHPIKNTEFNTIRNAFSVISVLRAVLPQDISTINQVTATNFLSYIKNIFLDMFYEEYIVQTLFNKVPILIHLENYSETDEWNQNYQKLRTRLNRTNSALHIYSLLQKQLLQLAIIRNITFIHDTACEEGNAMGCQMIKQKNMEQLYSLLPSVNKVKKAITDITTYGSTNEIIRDILLEDYEHIESITETFVNAKKQRFFLNGSNVDIISSLDIDECKGYRKNTLTNTVNRNMNQVVSFLINEKQIQTYLINSRTKPNREHKSVKNYFKNKYFKIQSPQSPSIQNEVITRLDNSLYKKLNNQSFMNTLKYLFYVMRTGIFVSIRNNALEHFIPFVNSNYHNDWSHLMSTFLSDYNGNLGESGKIDNDSYYGNKSHFIQQKVQGFRKENIMTDPRRWFINGCLIGNEMPRNFWGDGMIPELIHMFKTLCLERNIPDVDFFINKKDFPQLKKNLTHPSHHVYDDYNKELKEHKYSSYAPILGFNTTNDHLDIPIPNMDDWRRITHSYYSYQCAGHTNIETNVDWSEKKPTAFFRGGATGCGTDIQSNQRLKLAYISDAWKEQEGKQDLLDAGISKWAIRDKKKMGVPMRFVQPLLNRDFDKPWSVPLKLADYVPMDKQLEYKYVIYVDGNAAAYRYQTLMTTGSTILKVSSVEGFKMWFYDELKGLDVISNPDATIDGHDHIIIDSNLENLENVLRWCRQNDDKCRQIAQNSLQKVKTLFNYDNVLDYLEAITVGIHNNMSADSRKKSIMVMTKEKRQDKADERVEVLPPREEEIPITIRRPVKLIPKPKRSVISNLNKRDITILKTFFVRQ